MESINDTLKTTFRGPLPVLTESFQYILSLTVSIIASTIIFMITGFELDIMLAVILGIVLGVATQISLALSIPKFYGTILHDSKMDEILSKILGQVEPVGAFEIWISNSNSMFITSHTSLFTKSLVISEAMCERMKMMPENAEIVLAERVLELNRTIQYVNLLFTTAIFTILMLVQLYIIMPILLVIAGFMTIILGGPVGYLIGGLFVLLVIFRSATWQRSSAFEIVQDMYQIHPDVAEKCLLENRELSPLETEELLILLRHQETKNRSERMAAISIVVFAFSGLLGIMLLPVLLLLSIASTLIELLLVLILLVACVSFIAILVLVKRYDDRAIDRLYGTVELKTEPIWND